MRVLFPEKYKEKIFEIIAKSYKRKKAKGDEEKLIEIENEDAGKNLSMIDKIKIGNDVHTLLYLLTNYPPQLFIKGYEELGEYCDKYSINDSDKERIFTIMQDFYQYFRQSYGSLNI
mgnify:CR=1 FL=1